MQQRKMCFGPNDVFTTGPVSEYIVGINNQVAHAPSAHPNGSVIRTSESEEFSLRRGNQIYFFSILLFYSIF